MHCNFCFNRHRCEHSQEEVTACNEYCYIVIRKNYYYKVYPFQQYTEPHGPDWDGEVFDEN